MVDRDESRRGGTGRGTGLRAGCSPRSVSARFLGVVPRPGPASLKREPKSLLAAGLQPHRPGDALCHPLPLTRRKQRPTGRPWGGGPPLNNSPGGPEPFLEGRSRPGCVSWYLRESGASSRRFSARKIARMFAANPRARSPELWWPHALPACWNQSVISLIRTTLTRQKFGSYSASLESGIYSTTARRDPDTLA
jgi:hypothetical protein